MELDKSHATKNDSIQISKTEDDIPEGRNISPIKMFSSINSFSFFEQKTSTPPSSVGKEELEDAIAVPLKRKMNQFNQKNQTPVKILCPVPKRYKILKHMTKVDNPNDKLTLCISFLRSLRIPNIGSTNSPKSP